jgi:type IV pilus assembly protein PilY1
MKDMHSLADKNYGAKHRFYVDGSPQVMDIKDGSAWKTILVGGLNGGGRGYYALDVTNPDSPQPLWEFCYDSNYCNVADQDLGFSYGNPVIAKMPPGSANAGQWVVMVTSGYNNVSPGDGEGHLYVLNPISGAILQKVTTGVGDPAVDASNPGDPSGLAKISAWADNGNLDAAATYVYGGDLKGNLWRFNLQTSSITVSTLATLAIGNNPQPITTKPELGMVKGVPDRIVFVGTGRYLGLPDITNTEKQSIYAIRDTGVKVDGRSLTPRVIAQNGVSAAISGASLDWANGGWYADFPETRERVNIDPQLVLGTLLVATSTPVGSTCSPGGTSWIYQFDFSTGLNVVGASTLGQKKTSGLIVGIVVFRLPNGQLKGVGTAGDGTQDTFGVNVNAGAAGSRRTGWRELTQ